MTDETILVYNYEQRTNAFILIVLSGLIFYLLTGKIFLSLIFASFISLCVLIIVKRRKMIFRTHTVEVRRGGAKDKNFTVPYSCLENVLIEQILTTTYINLIFKFTFNIDGKTIRTSLDISERGKAKELYKWLETKGVKLKALDDYLDLEN